MAARQAPRPWDSSGRNTGVGCHFLLQCMKVKTESEVAQSYPTVRDPMDYGPPGSSVHGISQARVLEWGAIAFSVSLLTFYFYYNIILKHIHKTRQWHPTPALLPGKSHGWRSLVGCSPWGRQETDTTERLPFHFSLSCTGGGHGNPL